MKIYTINHWSNRPFKPCLEVLFHIAGRDVFYLYIGSSNYSSRVCLIILGFGITISTDG